MLLMLEKPRPTLAERAWSGASRAARLALAAAHAVVLWPFRVGENRRLLGTLAALSDHDLRDIGLTRGDLRDATALPAAAALSPLLERRRQRRGGAWN